MTRLQELHRKYQDNMLSEQEASELLELLAEQPSEEWHAVFSPLWQQALSPASEGMPPAVAEKIWQQLQRGRAEQAPALVSMTAFRRTRYYWKAGVAAALLLLVPSVWLIMRKSRRTDVPIAQYHVIKPGSDKAILTLSNGQDILLENASNGTLAEQGGIRVVKLDSGRLGYEGQTAGPVSYNTLTTPRGGQFRIVLPDGSRVWLNSSSALRYPTGFAGNSRVVQLTGEAYFEIAPDPQKPFHVRVKDLDVNVLGTAFNIMAYDDENSINTTLISGLVKVASGKDSMLVRPGEQARLSAGMTAFSKAHPNLDQVLAWKEGRFSFDNADIRTIMRQIARWYDVEIEYQGNIPESGFFGNVSRKQNVTQLLEILQESGGIHLELKGNRIIVTP